MDKRSKGSAKKEDRAHSSWIDRTTRSSSSTRHRFLAVRPELVDRSKFDEAARDAAAEWGISKFGAQLEVDTLDFSRSGATLDPREATAQAGKQIFKTAERRLVNLTRWLERAKESELKPKRHKD